MPQLVVVRRDDPSLYRYLKTQMERHGDIIVDRRLQERRERSVPVLVDRRRGERRAEVSPQEASEMQELGFRVVETSPAFVAT